MSNEPKLFWEVASKRKNGKGALRARIAPYTLTVATWGGGWLWIASLDADQREHPHAPYTPPQGIVDTLEQALETVRVWVKDNLTHE